MPKPTFLRFGTIDATDYESAIASCKARVRLTDKQPGILTKPLPILQSFAGVDKAFFVPKVGDAVAILIDDGGVDGVILGANYSKQVPPPVTDAAKHHATFEDGTTIEYDKGSSTLTINCVGPVDVVATGTVTIQGSQIQMN